MTPRHLFSAVAAIGLALGAPHARVTDEAASPPRSEQHWLATVGVEAVAHLASREPVGDVRLLPLDAPPAPPSRFSVLVGNRPRPLTLELTHQAGVWSPETYMAVARACAGEAPIDTTRASGSWLAALTDGRAATIARAARQLSAELAAHPRSPALHETAALVLGALAMREAGGHFGDGRVTLVRAAAHLATADALRGGAGRSPDGVVARAVLQTLAGRQADALATLRMLDVEAGAPGVAEWRRAIDIRTRLDWRVLTTPAEASVLERLQHVRALIARLDGDAGRVFVETHDAEPIADWGRILLGQGASVESTNLLAGETVVRELEEMAAVHAIVGGGTLDETAVVAAVAAAGPPRGPRGAGGRAPVEVVDWPLWADALERHLLNALLRASTRLRDKLSLAAEADAQEAAFRAHYSRLPRYPLLEALWVRTPAGFDAAMLALQPLWRTPERVPPYAWIMTLERTARARFGGPVGSAGHWFWPVVPVGTVPEDVWWRTHAELGQPKATRAADLEAWRQLAPYKRSLALDALALRYGAAAAPEVVQRELAAFLDFDVPSLHRVAAAAPDDPRVREQAFRRICDLSVDGCGHLAWLLIDVGREAEAAGVFRHWIDDSRDQVMASNRARWLVDYELDGGHRDAALALASRVADTGSLMGLGTLAHVLERLDRWDEARALHERVAARYEARWPLLGFYLRYAAQVNRARHRAETEALVRALFPKGLERLTELPRLAPPPDAGVRVTGLTRRLRAAGLSEGDLLIALDGYRIRTYEQFLVVSSLSEDPRVSLVYWREGGGYGIAQGRFPGRYLADRFDTHVRQTGR